MSLTVINEGIVNCHKCPLYKTMDAGCTPVIGGGNPYAQIMIVGEAPGQHEMLEGECFIGRSGKMLNKMLEMAGISRESIFITNTVKCFPRENKKARPPERYEIEACHNHLVGEIETIKPRVIIALGKTPTLALIKNMPKSITIGSIVGTIFQYNKDTIVIPNYHPSYLLQYGNKQVNQAISVLKKAKQYCIQEMKKN